MLSLLECPKVSKDLESRTPFLELQLPVEHDRGGHYYEVRAPVTLFTSQVGQERYRLDRLAYNKGGVKPVSKRCVMPV